MKIVIDAAINNPNLDDYKLEHLANYNDYLLNLLVCLGHKVDRAPVADILRKLHGLEGRWLVVSPIHWQVTHNDAMIVAFGHDLGLDEKSGRDWFAAFTKFVVNQGMKTHYHNPYTWLMQVEDNLTINSKSVATILHKSIMPELEKLDSTLYWARFITESQMYLSNHPLNKLNNTCYPINGIWVWGGGSLESLSLTPVVACDIKAMALAKLLSRNVSLYSPELKLTKKMVLACPSVDILESLTNKLAKKSIDWYWNNFAYRIQLKAWYKRFLR